MYENQHQCNEDYSEPKYRLQENGIRADEVHDSWSGKDDLAVTTRGFTVYFVGSLHRDVVMRHMTVLAGGSDHKFVEDVSANVFWDLFEFDEVFNRFCAVAVSPLVSFYVLHSITWEIRR